MNYRDTSVPDLQTLLDMEQTKQLMNQLAEVSGIAIALRDPSGEILLRTPARRICGEFLREHAEALELCERKPLAQQQMPLAGRIMTCEHGLIEAALPIYIEQQLCGSFYAGQLLFSEPDKVFFADQAKRWGFPVKDYLEALDEVPIISEKQLESFLELLETVVQIISRQAYQQLQLQRQTQRLEQLNAELIREGSILHEVHTIADVGYILLDREHRTAIVSEGIIEHTGTKPGTSDELLMFIHPEDRDRQSQLIHSLLEEGTPIQENRFRVVTSEGKEIHVISSGRVLKHEGETREALVILSDISRQAAYEQQLLEMNWRLEEAQELAQIGSFVYHRDSDSITLSREGYRILGVTEGQMLTLNACTSLVHPEDHPRMDAFLKQMISDDQKRSQAELRIFKRDTGTPVRLKVITGANQSSTEDQLFIGAFQDITEEHRVKQQLEDQHAFMKTLVETMPAGVFWMDRDLIVKGCNRLFAKDADETTVERVIGRRDRDFRNTKKDADKYDRENRNLMSTGIPLHNLENRIVRSDGKISYSYTNKVPIYDAQQHITGVLGVYTDITEMKEVYQQLEDRVNQLRAIVDTSSDPIILMSLSAELELISPSIEQVLGYTPQQCMELTLDQVLTQQSLQNVFQCIDALLTPSGKAEDTQHSQGALVELDMIHAQGHQVLAEIHITPMKDSGGTIYSLLGILRDVTQQKLLEQQLRQTQKIEAVGRLAGGIAHDFNNMLHVILGYADIIADRLDEDAADELIEPIKEAGKRSQSLVGKLLLFGRKRAPEMSEVDLGLVVHEFCTMMNPIMEGIECRYIGMPDYPVMIRGDEHQLNQVLFNICMNGKEAMDPEGGVLLVHLQEILHDNRVYARLSITDSGKGIAQEDVEHIFEPFYTRKSAGPSTGLGLPSVYAIMEQHDGEIKLYSKVGYGTRAELLLPLSGPAVQQEDAPAMAVLLAGRDEVLLDLCRRSLEDAGFQVHCARSQKELAEQLEHRDHQFSCVLAEADLFDSYSWTDQAVLIQYGNQKTSSAVCSLETPFTMEQLIDTVNLAVSKDRSAT